ncbi:MAG: CBS domain-containing protein [Elusimicrobia bacterium]|jgi:kojibiose phosphorylase|nr:CBS domain-containing protein [Elusimicrobiota bacterium]
MNKNYFNKYLSQDASFHISEDSFSKDLLNVNESVFTLGNGFLGSRGVFEENPKVCNPGTFIQGLYDKSGAQVEEIINLPNPINLIISVEGEKFDISTMEVLNHKRTLDMKNNLLIRKTRFKDAKGREYLYQSLRFFSMTRPHIGVMRTSLKLLKGKANLTSIDRLDDSVYNSGGNMIPRRRHYNPLKVTNKGGFSYIEFRTNTHKHHIGYCTYKSITLNNKTIKHNGKIFEFSLKGGGEITFNKIFSIYTSNDCRAEKISANAETELKDAVSLGFNGLLKEHLKRFSEKWENADIKISGSIENQRAIRFNIYHLLIAATEEFASSSIGARTLSGQGYRGHIFWDTEIYILPFFIFTQPETARNMLLFRYNTLSQAKDRARDRGFSGAMYPWESTVSGHEQTPRYAKTVDGSIGEVTTQDFEHHITADVAYSIYQYYNITGDKKFIYSYGAEIIFETAKFWASRAEYSEKDSLYHINNITGPDEFHVDVTDNAYTNYMAGWNLKYAAELYEQLKNTKTIKKLTKKIKVNNKTASSWKDIGEKIALSRSATYDIINQFNGYLRKKDYKARNYDMNFLPEIPRYYEYIGLEKTRMIKQPDVLALFHLFPDNFSFKEKLLNYNYYIYRTIHKSSLSYCFHSILAAELEDSLRAYIFFRAAAFIDLEDIAGNTDEGIHAASLGGVWQALIFGFAGLRANKDGLKIRPRLPGTITNIKFSIYYQKTQYLLKISNKKIMIKIIEDKKSKINKKEKIIINGKKITLKTDTFKNITFKEDRVKMIYAKDIMKDENFVTTGENSSLKEVGKLIIKNKASSIPIVDGDNTLKGIVSETIIIEATSEKNCSRLKVSDIMEKDVVTINYEDSIEKITEVFTDHPYRRLPVIKDKKVMGVITRKDIIADFLGGYY